LNERLYLRQELPLFKAMVCTMDGSGTQTMIVGRSSPDGTLKMINVLFNDTVGIKDCFGEDMMSRAHWDSIVSRMEDCGLSWVSLELPTCRCILDESRAINKKAHYPLPKEFAIWGGILQDGPESWRFWPDLGESPVCSETIADPKLLEQSYQLFDLVEFDSWLFDPDEIDEFAMMALEAMLDDRWDRAERIRRIDGVIDSAVKSLATPGFRTLLESRLRRQAWLLGKLRRMRHSRLAVAAATALDRNSGIPVEQHPFLREMAMRSIAEMISVITDKAEAPSNLREGASGLERQAKGGVGVTNLYELKVSLKGRTDTWRVIEIKGNQTLHTLHKAISAAFDRFEENSYSFFLFDAVSEDVIEYVSPDIRGTAGKSANRTRMDSLRLGPRGRFRYIFDFVSYWEHDIDVLKIREADPAGKYPRLVRKKGVSPPRYPDTDEE